ncbi:histidine kinase [Niveibacterium sp. SC-1]|uniref:sensor histidine kinase n=1 Tax=Niveibacterium sp. SC-1 TaxID=3135646 RepID=UPI00311E56DC
MNVLRVSGLVVCLLEIAAALLQMQGLTESASDGALLTLYLRAGGRAPHGVSIIAAMVAGVLAFATVYWRMAAPGASERHQPGLVARLFALDLMAMLVTPGLPFIVTALAAVRLPGARAAAGFALAQVALGAMQYLLLPSVGQQFESARAHLPFWLDVGGTLLSLLALHGMALGMGRMAADEMRKRRWLEVANAELASEDRLQSEQVRFAERLQLSRDLHDLMGHHLAALNLNLQLGDELLTRGEPERAALAVAQARRSAARMLTDVREVVHGMRHERRIDLSDALKELAERIARPHIRLELDAVVSDLSPRVAHAVLRCVQEAITNAVRHAQASEVQVHIVQVGEALRVEVRDDGRGAPQLQPGHGLAGMRARMTELGGELVLHSTGGRGFGLSFSCPRHA